MDIAYHDLPIHCTTTAFLSSNEYDTVSVPAPIRLSKTIRHSHSSPQERIPPSPPRHSIVCSNASFGSGNPRNGVKNVKKRTCVFVFLLCIALFASGCRPLMRNPSAVPHDKFSDWLWFTTSADEHFFLNLSDALQGKETIVSAIEFNKKVISESWVSSLYPQEVNHDASIVFYGLKGTEPTVTPFYYDLADRKKLTESEIMKFHRKEFAPPLSYNADKQKFSHQNRDGSFSKLQLDLNDQVKGSLFRMVYSPDHSKMAYQGEDAEHVKYLLIYDLDNNAIIDHVRIGKDLSERDCSFYISQWHDNNSIFLTINHEAYQYHSDTKRLVSLGEYLFYPMLTPDGNYLVYSKPNGSVSEDEVLTSLSDYGETGLFLKSIQPGATPIKLLDQDNNQMADQDIYPRQILHTKTHFEISH
ncbi:hypothetical protein [Gorillibacterium sp. sgz500922]|uniref:hypothetical protein n=1 Tax=Gorillibacterium sp. sgz500922 TaxID=3446694 RepID=UPI003F663992